jgi:hypothetical protein
MSFRRFFTMFFEVLSAINDPVQQGSIDQLNQVINSVEQVASSRGLDSSQMQNVMATLGNLLQPILRQQQAQLGGQSQLANQLSQIAGTGSMAGLQSFIPPHMQQQLAQTISQRTGIEAGTIQAVMPQLLTSALGLLNMGASRPDASGSEDNPLLYAFLDSDRNSRTDLGHVIKFAGRFLNAPSLS